MAEKKRVRECQTNMLSIFQSCAEKAISSNKHAVYFGLQHFGFIDKESSKLSCEV